jgi:hypothetical protein
MTATTRSRVYGPTVMTHNTNRWSSDGGATYPHDAGSGHGPELQGSQITTSDDHPGWRKRLGADMSDIGGDFYTTKSYVTPFKSFDNIYFGSLISPHHKWEGTVLPDIGTFGLSYGDPGLFPNEVGSTDSELAVQGTTAIASCEPTKSVADLSTGLGELAKDGLPSLPLLSGLKKRAKIALNAGDEFLNVAFGWMPLVNDVKKTSQFVVEQDQLISQFERDSGRPVRRRFRFPAVDTVEVDGPIPAVMQMGQMNYPPLITGSVGEISRIRRIQRNTWFSGSFTYYLPPSAKGREGIREASSNARQLLGAELNPEVLWNLAPWSWAVDWFTNAGDYSHNLSAFADNGLVMHYGYIMEHCIVSDTYLHSGPTGVVAVDGQRSVTFTTETKRRRAASPYGFGTSFGDLSDFQKSVVVALGLSRR